MLRHRNIHRSRVNNAFRSGRFPFALRAGAPASTVRRQMPPLPAAPGRLVTSSRQFRLYIGQAIIPFRSHNSASIARRCRHNYHSIFTGHNYDITVRRALRRALSLHRYNIGPGRQAGTIGQASRLSTGLASPPASTNYSRHGHRPHRAGITGNNNLLFHIAQASNIQVDNTRRFAITAGAGWAGTTGQYR